MSPLYLSVYIFQSDNLITFLDLDFSSSYKNCLLFVGNPFDTVEPVMINITIQSELRVLQSRP